MLDGAAFFSNERSASIGVPSSPCGRQSSLNDWASATTRRGPWDARSLASTPTPACCVRGLAPKRARRGRQRDRNTFACAPMPLLRRPDDHHRDVRRSAPHALPIANPDQDRHLVIITALPASQRRSLSLPTARRSTRALTSPRPKIRSKRRADVVSGSSAQIEVIPSIGWRTGQSATQKRPSVRGKRVATPPFLDFDSERRGRRASMARVARKPRRIDFSTPPRREVVRCVDRLGPAMPADNANGARLRALYPLLFGESDLGADL